jgi:hypothetical protein
MTERWWFQSLGYGDQFNRLFLWRAGSFLVGGGFFALWLGINAHYAWRNSSRTSVPLTFFETDDSVRLIPLEDKLQLDRYRRRLTVLLVSVLSWLAGLGCAARYDLFLRAFHASNTRITDKASNFDVGLFLFQIPFWNWLSRFCLGAIVAALLLVAAIYLYEELIGPAARSARLHTAFNKHLSLLWVILLSWKGIDCLLAVPNSFVSSGNVATRVFDPLDISLNWTSTALFALSTPLLALVSGLAIARHARLQTFLYGAGWMICSSAVPFLLPLVVGHDVQDNKWKDALERHIQSTRVAWGLDDVRRERLRVTPSNASSEVDGPSALRTGLPVTLWPARGALDAMNERLKAANSPARVSRVWLEKHGESLVYSGVAVAGASDAQLEWRASHLGEPQGRLLHMEASRTETHGQPIFSLDVPVPLLFGAAAAEDSSSFRRPDFEMGDPSNERANFSWGGQSWVLANAQTEAHGVKVSSFAARLALAFRFFEPELVSGVNAKDDLVVWNRGAVERCNQLVPFLDWQKGARPVRVPDSSGSHRLLWLVSGLVWSDNYPDSATPAAPGTAPPGANYGREVALGVVDARTGQTWLFCLDEDEPFMALYRRVFPGLFTPLTGLSGAISSQMRPSPSILKAQCMIWARYHENDGAQWLARKNDWRPLLSPSEVADSTLRSFSGPGMPDGLVMAYSPVVGQAGSSGPSSALSAILGTDQSDFATQRGRSHFVEWRSDTPLPLPSLAAEPSTKYMSGLPSPLISVAPRFNRSGEVTGLIAARGETKSTTSANRTRNDKTDGVTLEARIALLGSGVETLPLPVAVLTEQNKTLEVARDAWRDLRDARTRGNWAAAAQAEKRLNSALGTR